MKCFGTSYGASVDKNCMILGSLVIIGCVNVCLPIFYVGSHDFKSFFTIISYWRLLQNDKVTIILS